MNTCGARLAQAAATFLGVPFVLYGRDPKRGLDCVGLVAAALEAIGRSAPCPVGYGLRNRSTARWLGYAADASLHPFAGGLRSGDVVMTRHAFGQFHLAIVEGQTRMIHAHAGLRKVVRQPLVLDGEVLQRWRLADGGED